MTSLQMLEERRDGQWFVWFAWEDPSSVPGKETWEAGYWAAVRRKHGVVGPDR